MVGVGADVGVGVGVTGVEAGGTLGDGVGLGVGVVLGIGVVVGAFDPLPEVTGTVSLKT